MGGEGDTVSNQPSLSPKEKSPGSPNEPLKLGITLRAPDWRVGGTASKPTSKPKRNSDMNGKVMVSKLNVDPEQDDQFVWHYTTQDKFKQIVKSGWLLPSTVGIAAGESPILWFSNEPYWEPTAQKAVLQGGKAVGLGMQGTFERGGGLVRVGVLSSRLIQWPRLAKMAGIPSSIRRSLQLVAREQGAVPERWYGLIGQRLPLSDVDAIEVFEGNSWVRVPHQRGHRVQPSRTAS